MLILALILSVTGAVVFETHVAGGAILMALGALLVIPVYKKAHGPEDKECWWPRGE